MVCEKYKFQSAIELKYKRLLHALHAFPPQAHAALAVHTYNIHKIQKYKNMCLYVRMHVNK